LGHFPSLPKETTIEKVSDSDREKTDVEAARRQRLKAILSARGDGGSKSIQLAQQNLTPPHNVTPTLSEDFQLKLTLSAQESGRGVAKEIHQQRNLCASALLNQPWLRASQQWLQPHVPSHPTGAIPKARQPQQVLSTLPPSLEPAPRALDPNWQAGIAGPEHLPKDVISSTSSAPPTAPTPPPPQQKQTGAKKQKKRKKAQLIPEEYKARGITYELIVQSPIDDFNSFLENDPDITEEFKNIARDWRRKGKNRTAASKSRDRKMDRTEQLRRTVEYLEKQKKLRRAEIARHKAAYTKKKQKKIQCDKIVQRLAIERHREPEKFAKSYASMGEEKQNFLTKQMGFL